MASAFDLCSLSWGGKKGYVAIATRDPKLGKDDVGYWHDDIYKWPRDKDDIRAAIAKASASPKDVYFTPGVFSKPRRTGKVAAPTDMLWADLDTADPDKLPKSLKPTAVWETSPGRWQAIWKLDTTLPPDKQAHLNQRLTYAIGADKGGWDLAQVLRVPGTHNHKYPNSPTVKLSYLNGHMLDTGKILLDLPDIAAPTSQNTHIVEDLPDPKDVIRQYQMNARAKGLIRARHAQKGQRSDRLWELACLLAEAGAIREEIVAVTKSTVWNKFEGRHDELERLFAEADKALNQVEKKSELTDGITTDDSEVVNEVDQEIGPVAWRDFDRDHQPISWLVAECWGESEVGFISGLPKSYKSWIALDLAVSVATGTRFLDSFQTHKHNVLLIQEEDPKFVLQDRLCKIAADKGLIELETTGGNTASLRYELPDNLYIISNQGFTINEDWLEDLQGWIHERDIKLVILDPLMMMGEGFDEFKAFEMMQTILKPLKRLRAATGSAIAVVHHHFKGSEKGGARDMYGSVALWAWEEAALHLAVSGGSQVVADRFSKHSLLKPITIDIGDVEETWHPTVSLGAAVSSLADQIASSPGGATVEELSEATGMKKDALLRQLKALKEGGQVKKMSRPSPGPGRNKTVWVRT